MKIIFFGTPYFAKEILKFLIEKKINIIAVVTQNDKILGKRKYVSEVKKYIVDNNIHIPIFQPEKAKDESFIENLKKMDADLFVVVAYGQILTQKLLDLPKKGCINTHASILPKYRGANPIRYAILNGEKTTGVTIMKMVKKMDAGDIILKDVIEIHKDDNFQTLESKLLKITKPVLLKTLDLFKQNNVSYFSQDESLVTFAPKLTIDDRLINLYKNPAEIINQIRALSPYPGAFIEIIVDNEIKQLKILHAVDDNKNLNFKEIFIDKENFIIGLQHKSLKLLEIQLEGKSKMNVKDFLTGLKKSIKIK